uniref:(California timema) hypothetical protein n=1 Tax=Timema californicum TaxID=61474 RepID=A0A7R9IY03_TIMCA|nr:unnamed protein product [Timema californicum]
MKSCNSRKASNANRIGSALCRDLTDSVVRVWKSSGKENREKRRCLPTFRAQIRCTTPALRPSTARIINLSKLRTLTCYLRWEQASGPAEGDRENREREIEMNDSILDQLVYHDGFVLEDSPSLKVVSTEMNGCQRQRAIAFLKSKIENKRAMQAINVCKGDKITTVIKEVTLTIFNVAGYSCVDLLNAGMRDSGVYYLQIRGTTYWFLKVYCEQEVAEGGWTHFEKQGGFEPYSSDDDLDPATTTTGPNQMSGTSANTPCNETLTISMAAWSNAIDSQ